MKSRRIVEVFVAILIVFVLWWLFRPLRSETIEQGIEHGMQATSPVNVSPKLPTYEGYLREKKDALNKVVAAFHAPIEFYGRVVDQNGEPVPYANVNYGASDKFLAPGSSYTGQSDAKGYFQIIGIHGAGLSVYVEKTGYYFIDQPSDKSLPTSGAYFAYGIGPDSYSRVPPTKDNPAVFTLHKMGEAEALVYVGPRYYKVTKDGQPIDVDIETGEKVLSGQGDIYFERWANDQKRDQQGNFDWYFRITVPEGGLIKRERKYDFIAPENGYVESTKISMPASLGDGWSPAEDKSYFIKTRKGRYARIDISIEASHTNVPLTVNVFLNPTPGHRNLEYDKDKRVKVP